MRVAHVAERDSFFRFSDGGWSDAAPSMAFAGAVHIMNVTGTGFNIEADDYRLKFTAGEDVEWSLACAVVDSTLLNCTLPDWTYA